MVGRQGFEPWKPMAADLQSAPFVHLGTCPVNNSIVWQSSPNINKIKGKSKTIWWETRKTKATFFCRNREKWHLKFFLLKTVKGRLHQTDHYIYLPRTSQDNVWVHLYKFGNLWHSGWCRIRNGYRKLPAEAMVWQDSVVDEQPVGQFAVEASLEEGPSPAIEGAHLLLHKTPNVVIL